MDWTNKPTGLVYGWLEREDPDIRSEAVAAAGKGRLRELVEYVGCYDMSFKLSGDLLSWTLDQVDWEQLKTELTEEMKLLDFIDEICPEHDRTSCSDDDSHGNEFFNESGAPRCTRCAFLYRLKHGDWPDGAGVGGTAIYFAGHPRITNELSDVETR